MELELRKMNKINKSKKQNNYTSNVNPLDIIKGEKEVQVLKMELISELEEYYLKINKNKKKLYQKRVQEAKIKYINNYIQET